MTKNLEQRAGHRPYRKTPASTSAKFIRQNMPPAYAKQLHEDQRQSNTSPQHGPSSTAQRQVKRLRNI